MTQSGRRTIRKTRVVRIMGLLRNGMRKMARSKTSVLIIGLLVSRLGFAEDPPSAEAIVEMVMPSIVAIRAETPSGVSAGTGFVVNSSGVIVTNLHVIEGARRAAIKLHSGEQYTKVMVASYDEGRDLAILRIPGFDLPALKLGNSDNVKVGSTAYAIGNPLGLEESVTRGIVSSIRVGDDGTKVIQTDSAVSPGNSGGPLINEDGEVIGIVTFKVRGGESLNFAVPINYARALLDFETLITLDELARELGKEEVSLFAKSESKQDESLNGIWRSLTNLELTVTLRQDGEHLYARGNTDTDNQSYDLKLQQDKTYKGIMRGVWKSWYWSFGSRHDVTCQYETEFEILKYTQNRIEGRIKFSKWPESERARKKYNKTCGKSEPEVWNDFVWVRDD